MPQYGIRSRYQRGPASGWIALFSLLVSLCALPALAAPPARVQFQLRAECDCAPCCFALQSTLHKLPGVTRVDLSTRDRRVAVTFDEDRLPLPRLAATVAGTDLGKHSALIADLVDTHATPDLAPVAHLAGIRAAQLDAKQHRLLLELADDAPTTTEALAATLAGAGVAVRFDRPAVSAKSR
jgi:hypothetical protein